MKSKKILTILLSLAIMLTFMPTMAFADDVTTSSAGHSFVEINTVNANYEELKVLVEPTCDTYGVGEITCTTELNGDVCGAVKTVKISPLGHKAGSIIRISALDAIDYTVKDSVANANAKASYKAQQKTAGQNDTVICEGYVSVCENCGAYLQKGTTNLFTNWTQLADPTAHTEPSGTAKCAETFNCSVCGTEAKNADAEGHTYSTETRKAHIIKDTNGNETDYVQVVTRTCTVCGKTEPAETTVEGYQNKTINHGSTTRREITSPTPCKEASGQTPATPNGYEDVCNDCGMVVSSGQYPLVAHTYVTSAPYAKNPDDGLRYTNEVCAVCGQEKPNSEVAVGFAPAEGEATVAYEAVSNANCEQGSFVIATNTSAAGVVTKQVLSDKDIEEAITNKTFVKIGDKIYNKDKKTEVPYTEAVGHKFGTLTTVADATCTNAGLEAKVCENCGKVDHATVKNVGKALGHEASEIVVPAKCGEAGYSYKVCTRCNKYLTKDGKAESTTTEGRGRNRKTVNVIEKYDETKPVVSLGTACTYEWQTLEAATPFKMGTRAKVCTVCGDELAATKESVAKTTIAAPAVKSLKKKAKVTVKAVAGAEKYQILVNGKVSKTVTKAGKFTVKKYVKAGKKNKFQIRAINADGVKATSKAKTVKIKKK